MGRNAFKAESLNKGSLGIYTGFQVSLLIIVILFRLNYHAFDIELEPLIYCLSCLIAGSAFWTFYSWFFLTKSLFDPYLIFYFSVFLFNAGQPLLEIFHLNEDGILGGLPFSNDFTRSNLVDTLFLVILGLISLHLGALISLITSNKNICSETPLELSISCVRSQSCYKIGFWLLGISFLPAVSVLLSTLSSVLSGGYGLLYEQDYGTGLNAAPVILATFLMPASFFVLVGSKNEPIGRRIAGVVIFFYVLTRFFLGQRNHAVMPLIAFVWLWNFYIAPLPKTILLVSGSLIMFVVFPLVSVTRSVIGMDRLSLDFLIESFTSIDNPVIASIAEMGSSMMTVAYSLQLVPSLRNFQLGVDYIFALFTLIPNVFGDLHPTIARGLIERWLTEQVNPYFAAAGGSYGLSLIAEAYVNFGWIGTPITLIIISFLFTRFTLWAMMSRDPAKLAMLTSFLSFFLFYARAESAIILRPLVWYSLFPYIWVCFLDSLGSRKFSR